MTDVPTSLPACAKRHPDAPSQVASGQFIRNGGESYTRIWCALCKSIAAKEKRARHKAKSDPGIYRLTWTPPEVLLAAPVCIDNAPTSFEALLIRLRVRDMLERVAA